MNKLAAGVAVSLCMLGALFLLTGKGFSVYAAHVQANMVLIQIEDYCSGVVIDREKGYVVTAAHCVEDFEELGILFKETHSGARVPLITLLPVKQTLTRRIMNDQGQVVGKHQYEAILLGKNVDEDVAVLKITTNLKRLPSQVNLSKRAPYFGQEVFSIGNPGDEIGTVSKGVVLNPKVTFTEYNKSKRSDMIRHSAYMNQGSSGGGLLDDRGELLGVTNWTSDQSFLATPVSNVVKLMKKLKL